MPDEKVPEEVVIPGAAEEDSPGKNAIYEKIGAYVKDKTGKRIGRSGGREVFDIVVNEVFALATQHGSMRFNGGFGSLHVKTYQEGERRLPSGQMTKFGKRQKLRYEEGVVVKALVANGGNLTEALKVRGVRAPKVETVAAGTLEVATSVEAKPVVATDESVLDLA